MLDRHHQTRFLELHHICFAPIVHLLNAILQLESVLHLLLLNSQLFSKLFQQQHNLVFHMQVLPIQIEFVSPELNQYRLLQSYLPKLLLKLKHLDYRLLHSLHPLTAVPLQFLSDSLQGFFFANIPTRKRQSMQ
ncbi:hypothetical protein AMPH_20706 [Acinetobacter baumannii]|nr:hypothetical protein AMPH_20706 [Acinetobacter baumannii]